MNFTEEEKEMDIRDIVKSLEAACRVTGITITRRQEETDDELGYRELKVLATALNTDPKTGEVWIADVKNHSQAKWNPWHYYKPGVGLSFNDTDRWTTTANVGSRLQVKSEPLARYMGENFIPQYEKFLM